MEVNENGICYTLNDDGTFEIYVSENVFVVPEHFVYDGKTYTIKRIDGDCFYDIHAYTVVIPASVTEIDLTNMHKCDFQNVVYLGTTMPEIYTYDARYNIYLPYVDSNTEIPKSVEYPQQVHFGENPLL
jgi:hypothetical protein